ncbi:hypothetical protein [Tenacibaculum sp.]|uniref:hypothetical protein n=1 Tax=Tenacibaculum sp. TaxID=1906242 RepID=UPI003D0E0052
MIKQLITDFFNAIEKREFKTNKNAKAVFWANELQEVGYNDENYISERKAKRYYEKYVEEKEGISVSPPNSYQRDFIANYLNYRDYQDYIEKHTINKGREKRYETESNSTTHFPGKEKKQGKKQKSIIVVGSIIIIPFLFVYKEMLFNSNTCIIWEKDHYEKASCLDQNSIDNTQFPINIDTFKKITLTKDMEFFTNGEPNYWYGSNKEGTREFFTARGVHPETLKELAPVTRTILKDEGLLLE